MSALGQVFNDALLFAIIAQATPIFLAALGGAFTQQANILNIALDGMMLMGAFVGIAVGAATQDIWLGLLAAIGAGVALAIVFGWSTLWAKADVVVAGIGIGLVASGLTLLLLEIVYHNEGSFTPPQFPHLPTLHLGVIAQIPIIGPAFEGQTILVGLAVIAVPIAWWILFRTPFGIHVRSIGENEEAAVAVGLPARRLKMVTILIAGALSGLAGAQLAMASLDQFVTNMTNGRGYIAVAAIFVGRARPLGVAIGCLAFGAASAIADQLQLQHLPSNLMLMLPYAVTVVVLLGRPLWQASRRSRRAGRSRGRSHETADA